MFKPVISLCTASILVLSSVLTPYTAFAEVVTPEANEFADIPAEEKVASSCDSAQDAELDSVELNEGAAGSMDAVKAGAIGSEQVPSLNAQSESDVRILNAEETIDFVYIDQSVNALGSKQYIAISLRGIEGDITSAVLQLIDEEGVDHSYGSVAQNGSSVLFEMEYTEDAQALSYTIAGLIASTQQAYSYSIDFELAEDQQQAYTFDVVTEDTLLALNESNSDGVSAVTLNKSGKLEPADSVEDALSAADAQGVQESIENATSPQIALKRSRSVVRATRENYLIVAIDPGHGGGDPGTSGNGVVEKDVNWSIANHFKNELATYTGVTPYLTTNGEEPGLQARVERAVNVGADVFISVHVNSSAASSANGCEVWVPNNSTYNYGTHTVGQELGNKIENELVALGLNRRGVLTRNYPAGEEASKYADGSTADYYSVIRNARKHNIPAIIVEHAFVSNSQDAAKLKQDSFRKQLGIADARGVAAQYNLGKDSAARQVSSVAVKAHVAKLGWESTIYDKKVSGTTGKNMNLEAFQITTMNAVASAGGITYRADIGGTWQSWKSNGETAGTTGQSKAIQAVQIKLTGDAANKYDVYYHVHVANKGWLGWTKNGASAGTSGYNYGIQAIEVLILNKGAALNESTNDSYLVKPAGDTSKPTPKPSLSYRAHVQNIGWQGWTSGTAGTTGKSLRVEALQLKVNGDGLSGSVESRAHVENIGWQDWKNEGSTVGTTGKSLRVEAVQFRLTGTLATKYDIYYRVHASNIGWMGWAKNGAMAGTSGYALRLEAVDLKLVPKGAAAPGSTSDSYRTMYVKYRAHVQNIGWQSIVHDGSQAGTTGRNLRMEALDVNFGPAVESGDVLVQTHVQNIGWTNYTSGTAGTTGRGLAIEAVRIKLTGAAANLYDVYYRVHSADFGWLGWTKNGQAAGSEGFSKSVQSIQIKLVNKGGNAPGAMTTAFRSKYDEPIMGKSRTTVTSMSNVLCARSDYPSNVFASKGASTPEEFCKIVYEEASAEGVRAEVVFGQIMHETGWLKFGGSVKAEQCNFAGLGATNSTEGGATFNDVRTGIRAQVQHLKAYASTAKLNKPCVDPRFNLVKRGSAPMLFDLNGKWAVPGETYGQSILSIAKIVIS